MFWLPVMASPSPLLSAITPALTTFWLPLITTPVAWFHWLIVAPAESVPIWFAASVLRLPLTWIPSATAPPDESWIVKPSMRAVVGVERKSARRVDRVDHDSAAVDLARAP